MAEDHVAAEAVPTDDRHPGNDPDQDLPERRALDRDHDHERCDHVDEVALGLEERRRALARPARGQARPDRQGGQECEERPVSSRDDHPLARDERGRGERGERDRRQPPRPREVAA